MQKSIEIKEKNSLSEKDFLEIYKIEKASFRHPWKEGMFFSPSQKFVLAFENKKIIGYICFSTVIDECHILNVAVSPRFREKGIAQKMFEFLFELGKKKNFNFYYLEVSENNLPAISLYKKLGFKTLGKRKKYYEDGSDAIVMVKQT